MSEANEGRRRIEYCREIEIEDIMGKIEYRD
jgi:hypothetical protein